MAVGSSPRGDDWLAELAARSAKLAEDSAETAARLSKKWGDRSLAEGDEWTVDSVTADLIEAWEYWTPLVGQGLDLGLEAFQRALRPDEWDV